MMRRTVTFVVMFAIGLTLTVGPRSAMAQGYGGHGSHTVKPGETLYSIARYYGADPMALASANGLVNPDMIFAGQSLLIPGGAAMPSYGYDQGAYGDQVYSHGAKPGGCSYTVAPGDSLYGIAARHGTSVTALMQANGLANPDVIFAGQTLTIPGCGYAPPSGPVYKDHPVQYPTGNCGGRYIVRPGDTVSGIAMYAGTTVWDLAAANGLKYPYMIYSGQSLFLPCGSAGYYPSHPVSYKPKPSTRPGPKPAPAPSLSPAACPREVQIVRPLEKQTVSDVVSVIGTADIANFQFYKVEYAIGWSPLDSSFNSINHTYHQNVVDSILTTWYVGNMPDGNYTLRLTAVDNAGQWVRPCDVHITIK